MENFGIFGMSLLEPLRWLRNVRVSVVLWLPPCTNTFS